MRNHPGEEILNDYVDGLLGPDRVSSVAEHLAVCEECRAEVDALRTLLSRAATLPARVYPTSDLWPGIAAGIESGRVIDADFRSGRPGRPWSRFVGLAVAAAALVAVSSSATVWVLRGQGGGAPAVANAPADPAPVAAPGLRPAANGVHLAGYVEAGYGDALSELQAALAERRDEVSPATLAVIEENLRIIDDAIAAATAALEEDPSNRGVAQSLTSSYQQKVDLLRRAVMLPRQI